MPGFWCAGFIVMRCFADIGGGTVVECPPLPNWTPSFQKQVAAELRAAPKNSAMARAVVEAIGTRGIIRACHKAKGKGR